MKSILPECNLCLCDDPCCKDHEICEVPHYTIIEQEHGETGSKRYKVSNCLDLSITYGNFKHLQKAETFARQLYYLEAINHNKWLFKNH